MKKKTLTPLLQPTDAVAHRPGARKLLRFLFWLLAVSSVFLVVYPPFQRVMHTRQSLIMPTGPRDAYRFDAILFQRDLPPAEEQGLSALANLQQQIEILHANGYQPIRTADIAALLQHGQALPRKALLLAVDGQDAQLVRELDRVTRKVRWGGVVFISTYHVGEEASAPSWNRIGDMAQSQRWEVGTYGHWKQAEALVATNGTATGNPLTHRIWLPGQRRLETTDEYAARILAQHEAAASLFDTHLDTLPVAYAFPQGDAGQFSDLRSSLARLNATAVSSIYPMAFIQGHTARNARFTPPSQLQILPVDPAWSSQQVLAEIQRGAQNLVSFPDPDIDAGAAGWIADWGRVTPSLHGLTLQPAGEAKGSRIWIGGSSLFRDLHATLRLRVQGGGVRLALRAYPHTPSGACVDFYRNGTVEVWEKSAADRPERRIARSQAQLTPTAEHTLTLTLRENALNVLVDGIRVFPQTIRLQGKREGGQFGIALIDAESKDDAKLEMLSVVLQRPREKLISWDLSEQALPYLVDTIHRNGSTITKLSPALPIPGAPQASTDHTELLQKLGRVYHMDFIPKVTISDSQSLREWNTETIKVAAGNFDNQGVYVSFEAYEDLDVRTLDRWLRQTDRVMREIGKPLLLRLPQALEQLTSIQSLLAIVPAVQIVTGTDTTVQSGLLPRSVEEQVVTEPTTDERNSVPEPEIIPVEAPTSEPTSRRAQIARLAADAEQAFASGAFESAIAFFADWHDLAPAEPRPLRRIGDALVNLGYHDEATSFYRQALDLLPDDIDLAARLAQLYLQTGRTAASRSLLNIYARLFPQNTDILLAQADWLIRANRHREAAQRIQQIEALDPDNFNAILFQFRVAEDDAARNVALERLIRVSRQSENQQRLLKAIQEHDLLTFQNSYLLVSLMNDLYHETQNPDLKQMILSLEPLREVLTADFSEQSALPDLWEIDGGSTAHDASTLLLQANPARTRMTGRLHRSERWRDAFIEMDIADVRGGLWLHARQNHNQLIRMGFETGQDRLHLQIWGGPDNDLLESQFIPWSPSGTGDVLRLEVRGNGVIGYHNETPMFDAPLQLPDAYGFGWTAFAVDATIRGDAELRLNQIRSGPLYPHAAIVPLTPPDSNETDKLQRLHASLRYLTDISPEWYQVHADGTWESYIQPETDFYRIFSRYYRLRLTPVVKIAASAEVDPQDLVTICRTHGYDGLLLWFANMPDDAWFAEIDRTLQAPDLDIIAMAGRPNAATVRGIAGNSNLFRPAPDNTLQMLPLQTKQQWENNRDKLTGNTPTALQF